MNRFDVFYAVASEIVGLSEGEILQVMARLQNSSTMSEMFKEYEDHEAEKVLQVLRKEKPVILAWIAKSACDFHKSGPGL